MGGCGVPAPQDQLLPTVITTTNLPISMRVREGLQEWVNGIYLSIILSLGYNSIQPSMKPFARFSISFLITVALLLSPALQYRSNSCFSGCKSCEIFSFYMYCNECLPMRYLDQVTGLCPCLPGLFQLAGTCLVCPNYCLTCSRYGCTSCSADKLFNNGRCICKNGYATGADGNCDSNLTPTNIGLILGIAFGVAVGLVCFVTVVVMIRKRRFHFFQQNQSVNDHFSSPNAISLEVRPESSESSAIGTILDHKLDRKYSFRNEICSICLQESPLCITECGHYFHERCIGQWIRKRKNCPNCNQGISRKRLLKWCNTCRKELIRPQFSQFYRIGRNAHFLAHLSAVRRELIARPEMIIIYLMDNHDNQQLHRLFTKKKSFYRDMETISKRYFEFQQQVYYLPIKDINPDMIVKVQAKEELKNNHRSRREDIYIINGQYQPRGEKSFEKLILQLVQTIPRPKSAYGIIYINTLADSEAYNDFKKVLQLLPIQYLVNLTKIYVLNASFFNKAFSWLSFGVAISFINKKTINVEDLRELTLQSHVDAEILKEKLPKNVMISFMRKQKPSREQGPRGICVPEAEKMDKLKTIKREHISTNFVVQKPRGRQAELMLGSQPPKLPPQESGKPLGDYELGPTGAPVILEMLIYYFNNKEQYLKVEGLFRKSVSIEDQATILTELDNKNYNYLETVNDPHLIANAIKRFLCNIREPIVPNNIFEQFMDKNNDPQFNKIVIERVKSLPKTNKMIVFLLFDFLINKMVPHSESSKMGINNLCIVFGPCLMRSAVASIMDLLYAKKIIVATNTIYNEFQNIFGDRVSQLKIKRNSYKEYRISEMKERQSREGKESPIRLGKEQSSSSSEQNQQEQAVTPTFQTVTLLNRTSLFIKEALEKVESEDEIEEIQKEEPIQNLHREISYDEKEVKPVNLFISPLVTQEYTPITIKTTEILQDKEKSG